MLLLLFVLIAAAINVPWALSFKRSQTTINKVPMARLDLGAVPDEWPAKTPHAERWPKPEHWTEGGVFGCRVYDVRTPGTEPGRNGFSMSLQRMGWPLAVIEEKQMWWDWDNPKLAGPESDPAPSLMLGGLFFNPLILGGGAWCILILPWFLGAITIRTQRKRKHRCMACGYPVGASAVCTECGSTM